MSARSFPSWRIESAIPLPVICTTAFGIFQISSATAFVAFVVAGMTTHRPVWMNDTSVITLAMDKTMGAPSVWFKVLWVYTPSVFATVMENDPGRQSPVN